MNNIVKRFYITDVVPFPQGSCVAALDNEYISTYFLALPTSKGCFFVPSVVRFQIVTANNFICNCKDTDYVVLLFNFHTLYELRFFDWLICIT